MRQGCTSCVEYLPGRTCRVMNKNAKVKRYIHEAKLCIHSAWFFVHLSSCRTKEHCVGVGIMYAGPCSFPFFLFLQKVSGQQILEICVKDFAWICCSHSCFRKVQIQKIHIAWIPKCLPSFYFIIFLREFYFEKIFLLFTIFFPFQKSLNKAKLKLHNITKRYLTIYSL